MELRERLKPYCDALVKGMEDENWYLALMAALTLPDICTSLEGSRNKDDYIKWFDKYVKGYRIPIYLRENEKVTKLPNGGTVTSYKRSDTKIEVDDEHKFKFFTGVTAYVLRCTFLHNGGGEIGNEDMSKKEKYRDFMLGIKKVKFFVKNSNLSIERRTDDDTIRLNPRHYCQATLEGVQEWIKENKSNQDVLTRAEELIIFE
ncbi:hypothetical protein [Peribacillus frigoritolerans]|uniref:Uncharacterized protein n=1 Tax=Peribacillus frigoritolerans TaxID=450367 RepID=A0AAJ1QJT5_9BACI|nr:hypothetical protein [Peribacillus frigoritolerans]MDM5282677.1 hypothetical protein [Peribacillus frigoritolerans]